MQRVRSQVETYPDNTALMFQIPFTNPFNDTFMNISGRFNRLHEQPVTVE